MKKIEYYNHFYDDKDYGFRICWNWRTFYNGEASVVFSVTYRNGHAHYYHVMGENGYDYIGESAVEANRMLAIALRDIGVI